jgi:DNA-binding NtrC family response regulator
MLMQKRILICDDETSVRRALAQHLRNQNCRVDEVADAAGCLSMLEMQMPHALLLDLNMPNTDGILLLKEIQSRGMHLEVPILLMVNSDAVVAAIAATKFGAKTYVQKPLHFDDVSFQLWRMMDEVDHAAQLLQLKTERPYGFGALIGTSKPLQNVLAAARVAASSQAGIVLIEGESGTGKKLLAQNMHVFGSRKHEFYEELDCAKLSPGLIESALFGHERRAFSEVENMRHGALETVGCGTLHLSEVAELALGTQAKLLNTLDRGCFKRVGGADDVPMRAGILASTNRNLKESVLQRKFREDLYFKFHVVPVEMPPLRERVEDIPLLVQHFVADYQRMLGQTKAVSFSDDATNRLVDYPWPGNVRELKNIVERALILHGEKGEIKETDLPRELGQKAWSMDMLDDSPFSLPKEGVKLEEVEKNFIKQALMRTGGNQSQSARLLGISRFALRYRMEKHKMEGLNLPKPAPMRQA